MAQHAVAEDTGDRKEIAATWVVFCGILLVDWIGLNLFHKHDGILMYVGLVICLGSVAAFLRWHKWVVRIHVRACTYTHCDRCDQLADYAETSTGKHHREDS